jgi:hypothetical protein
MLGAFAMMVLASTVCSTPSREEAGAAPDVDEGVASASLSARPDTSCCARRTNRGRCSRIAGRAFPRSGEACAEPDPRDGALSDARLHHRFSSQGVHADLLLRRFSRATRRWGLDEAQGTALREIRCAGQWHGAGDGSADVVVLRLRRIKPNWVESGCSLIGTYGLRGSRIVNSLYSPTLLSTAMLPPCCCVTMS